MLVSPLASVIHAFWDTVDGFGRCFGFSRVPSGALGIVRTSPREGKRGRGVRQREILLRAVGAGHGTGDPEGQDHGCFHAGDNDDDTTENPKAVTIIELREMQYKNTLHAYVCICVCAQVSSYYTEQLNANTWNAFKARK